MLQLHLLEAAITDFDAFVVFPQMGTTDWGRVAAVLKVTIWLRDDLRVTNVDAPEEGRTGVNAH